MGFRTECPWCDKNFESSRYPRTAGYRDIMKKKKHHMKNKHNSKMEKYKNIVEIWKEKTESESLVELYFDVINAVLGRAEGFSSPNYGIVNEYEPEELEDLSEEEIRNIVERF